MKPVYFPGNMGQPCKALCGIALGVHGSFAHATIVVYQGPQHMPATSILNAAHGLNIILNSVLDNDLRGVRVEFVSFVAVLELEHGRLEARDFPINVDIDDYIARGNRYDVSQVPADGPGGALLNLIGKGDKRYSFWSGDVVGGCARFFLEHEKVQGVTQAEAATLLEKAGLN